MLGKLFVQKVCSRPLLALVAQFSLLKLVSCPQAVMARDLIDLYADIVAGYSLSPRGLLDLLAATWGLGARH